MDIDEQELVKRFQLGDEAARDDLFIKHYPSIQGYIYGLLRTGYQSDRDDLSKTITNDALLKAWDKRTQFDKDKSKFTTWLHEIAKNILRDEFRKIKRKQKLIHEEHPRLDNYHDVYIFSFGQTNEEDKKYVPNRKEKRERLDFSELDKSTMRLLGRIVAYGGNFEGVKLSPRERKIIAFTSKLRPKKEIARKLGISIPTCDTAICRIIRKLPVKM